MPLLPQRPTAPDIAAPGNYEREFMRSWTFPPFRRLALASGITCAAFSLHSPVAAASVTSDIEKTRTAREKAQSGTQANRKPPLSAEEIAVIGRRQIVARDASTGTKTDTPLIETTQTVSVVTRAFMDERMVQTINEALRYTPGVNADTYGADSRFDWLRIRGFDATTYGMYLDGMRFTPGTTGPVQEQYGLERVEVLNGPASVLYGQAAPGGLVNMVSKTPKSTPHQEIQFMAGSFDRYQGQFDLTGPVPGTGGAVDGRIIGLARDSDTQVREVKDNRIYVAPSFTWHISRNDDFTFLSSYLHTHTAGLQFVPANGSVLYNPYGKIPTDLFTGSPDLNRWDVNQATVGFLYEHRFNSNWRFQQNFRYMHLTLGWRQAYGTGLLPDYIHLTRLAYAQDASGNIYTSDSRIVGHIHRGPVEQTVLLGFDYQRGDSWESAGYAAGTLLNVFHPVYTPQSKVPMFQHITQTMEQKGLYWQDQMKLFRRVIVTLGGRYDWTDTLTHAIIHSTAAHTGQNNDVFTYRGGLGYLFPFGLMTYASYSRSFQPTSGTNLYGQPFKPTYGKQVEIGVKYQPTSFRSFMTASLFDLKQTNVSQADPANPLNTIQTGQIRVRGFETSVNVSLADGVDVVFAYTYLDPVITHSTIGQVGKRPTLIPRNTLSLWGDYQMPTTSLRALQGIGVGMGLRYIGNIEANNYDTFATPSVTLFDAALHYDFNLKSKWRIGVNINNIFNKTYVASCTGSTSCYYGQKRQVLGTIRTTF
ncbi:Fe3+ siderophore receptor [Acidomonas methanolica NBRC 104435]|uniref:Fe3+ siderophore receptor n=2 Tax=Acidomonas methanolica TaxID=437 RepID=A0A023D381_ACIMT|nr:iron complex outermembrane receptor protein [Acidomonas methanolica]GAJ28251.1 Fe3+ siderophore receptor [Acidomonas methanolica NBRC 104435]GEK98756.1 ligand-gated channel [Acidomonas methanolica NBRC 104435]